MWSDSTTLYIMSFRGPVWTRQMDPNVDNVGVVGFVLCPLLMY
jgi:hypothetical protein